jgi:hypothetical protein
MTATRSYGSPAAFRRALTDRLKAKAESSRWTLPHLQRQMAYDRLLERLYLVDDGWIVKGATALLARDIGVRATIDIDVYRRAAREVAEADLREAAGRDIGDWFRFEVGVPRPVADAAGGVRLPVTASIGTTVWASFHVDLVGTGLRMTGEPEHVPPLARVVMPDVEQHGYRAYPLIDHIADKVAAMFELHGRHVPRPLATRTWSTWSPSSSLRGSAPSRRWRRSGPRRTAAGSGYRVTSPSRTASFGSAATRQRRSGRSCRPPYPR